MMKMTRRRLAGLVLAGAIAAPALAAVWSSSDRWGSWTSGSYTLYNNIWGSGYGPQTIWANSATNWGVWADHPAAGGIKSYPNATFNVNRPVSAINTLKATVSASTPAGGAWSSTFDIWDSGHQHEIMLWLNYTGTANGGGNVKPISYNWSSSGNAIPAFTNVNVGGHTWNVYRGSNGANEVFSFLRTSKTNNATIDVKAVLNWLVAKGWMGNVTVTEVQYGFEITSSPGGMNFVTNNFTVQSN